MQIIIHYFCWDVLRYSHLWWQYVEILSLDLDISLFKRDDDKNTHIVRTFILLVNQSTLKVLNVLILKRE